MANTKQCTVLGQSKSIDNELSNEQIKLYDNQSVYIWFQTPSIGVSESIQISLSAVEQIIDFGEDGTTSLRLNVKLYYDSQTGDINTDDFIGDFIKTGYTGGFEGTLATKILKSNTRYILVVTAEIAESSNYYTVGTSNTTNIGHEIIIYYNNNNLFYIDDGIELFPYKCYIDNGTTWDLYIPYVEDGSTWEPYN